MFLLKFNSNRFRNLLIISCTILAFWSCRKPSNNQPIDDSQIKKEVEMAVWAFHTADTSKNAAGVIDLLWPEYTMLVDGKRISYDEVAKGSKEFMSNLVLFYSEWSDLKIIPISKHAAISSFTFRDSIISKTGELIRTHGPTTLLWQQRDGEWRMLYGDSDHYPGF